MTTPEQTPDEVRELLGAYALGALDPDERAQVDALLLADATARAELHELEQAAAWLGHASLRPPTSAWDAIRAEVDRDRVPAMAPHEAVPEASAEPSTEMPAPTPIRSRTERRFSRLLVAAAAVVALAIGAAGVFTVVDRSSSSDTITTQYEAALSNPKAQVTTLRSQDGQYSARAVVLRNHTGYLADAAMPSLPSGRDYQLWSITPDGPVSVGLMRGNPDIRKFTVVDATTALAVTNEPRGGSPTPTGTPVVSGDLRSV